MQFSVNRRRSRDGLSVGAAYSYQIVNKNLGSIDPFLSDADNRARNYNSAQQGGRRPHSLTINYSYEVPNLSGKWDNIATKAIFDNWQISGITTILSGSIGGFGYNYSGAPTGTLTGNGSIDGGGNRPDIICDPFLPRGQRTNERQFKTECIAPPKDALHFGNAKGDEFQGPGFNNWDISLFKNVPVGGTRRLQLRFEFYNAFNTDQWTATNTTATFDWNTGVLQNPTVFGRLTGATNNARRIQLGARFTF
jgi:hypothetical protein